MLIPYKAFPFVNPSFQKAGLIPVEDAFHDTLFPYSELFGTKQEFEEIAAANGVTKVYIAAPTSELHYNINEPVVIYRKYNGPGQKGFKSVATCFCTVTRMNSIIKNNLPEISLDEFFNLAGNKTVYSLQELEDFYKTKKNLIIIEMVYNGFFGKGNNVNYYKLKDNGLFAEHPYKIRYTRDQFELILKMGGKNVQDVIIDQS